MRKILVIILAILTTSCVEESSKYVTSKSIEGEKYYLHLHKSSIRVDSLDYAKFGKLGNHVSVIESKFILYLNGKKTYVDKHTYDNSVIGEKFKL